MINLSTQLTRKLGQPFRIGDDVFVYLKGGSLIRLFCVTRNKCYTVDGKTLKEVIEYLKQEYSGRVIYLESVEYVHHKDQLTIMITDTVYGVKSSYILQEGNNEAIELILTQHPH